MIDFQRIRLLPYGRPVIKETAICLQTSLLLLGSTYERSFSGL